MSPSRTASRRRPVARAVVVLTGTAAVLGGCGGAVVDGAGSAASTPSTSAPSGGAGGSLAAFCRTYDLHVVENAGSDPHAAFALFAKLRDVAPPEVSDDVELVYKAFEDAFRTGKVADASGLASASGRIARYWAEHCR